MFPPDAWGSIDLALVFDNQIQGATDWHHKASLAYIYKRREQEAPDHMGGA